MTRAQLEHVIRAAGAIADVEELVVVGSQAILASFPDAPAELLATMEVELYPAAEPGRAALIDGAIGEASLFRAEFGYCARGVAPEAATLPPRWRERAVRIRGSSTRGVSALCPRPADLAVSKLVAAGERDLGFVRVLLANGLVSRNAVLAALSELDEARASEARRALGSLV